MNKRYADEEIVRQEFLIELLNRNSDSIAGESYRKRRDTINNYWHEGIIDSDTRKKILSYEKKLLYMSITKSKLIHKRGS